MVRKVFWTSSQYNYTQFHCLDLELWLLISKFVSKFCLGGLSLCGHTVIISLIKQITISHRQINLLVEQPAILTNSQSRKLSNDSAGQQVISQFVKQSVQTVIY